MNDPERLLSGGATEVERQLLEAGVSEEPSNQSMTKAAAAIGLATAAGLAAQSAIGAGTTSAVIQTAGVVKWLGLGVVGVGLVVAIGYTVASQSASSPRESQPTPPPEPVTLSVPTKHKANEKEVPAKPASQEEPPPQPKASVQRPPKPSKSGSGSLREQIAMVDEARQKLAASQPQGALAALDRYQRSYPQGALGQEAMLLRIEALAQMGNRKAARSLATRFLRSQPSSPHRKRIESLVGEIDIAGK